MKYTKNDALSDHAVCLNIRFGLIYYENSESKTVKTTCKSCHGGCRVLVTVRNGVIAGIEGDPDSFTQGTMCAKGLASIQEVENPNRLLYPMKRKGQRGEGKRGLDTGEIERLIEERNAARRKKNRGKADEIRKTQAEKNVTLKDTPTATAWENRIKFFNNRLGNPLHLAAGNVRRLLQSCGYFLLTHD